MKAWMARKLYAQDDDSKLPYQSTRVFIADEVQAEIAKRDKVIESVHSVNRISALRIAEMLAVIDVAIDFIEQNEMQGSRMEVAEYDDLRDAVKPFMPETKG